jgi:hypothetical protein
VVTIADDAIGLLAAGGNSDRAMVAMPTRGGSGNCAGRGINLGMAAETKQCLVNIND